MTLAIFTLVQHRLSDGKYHGYAPYVREMDIWNSYFDEVIVVAPLSKRIDIDAITIPYKHTNLQLKKVPVFNVKSITGFFNLLIGFPKILFTMWCVMRSADHFHFRCPSNVSAVASILQIFFPKKKKTMRYAGNWDPYSKQPLGYRFQKFIFSNTFLTKNIIALVYGHWPNQTKNIRPFFAATFTNEEKEFVPQKEYIEPLKFSFIGALVSGKQPLKAIKIIEGLNKEGIRSRLDIYGDGILKNQLENYIIKNTLTDIVTLKGTRDKKTIKQALKHSHFNILPSKSEGWPKAIAEGMFFGAIPISTNISCLEWMLDKGQRGILISDELEEAVLTIKNVIEHGDLKTMSKNAQEWSQNYTIERQNEEIKAILNK